jgi:hypothetical protein
MAVAKKPIVLITCRHGKTVAAPLCGQAGNLSVPAVAEAVERMVERLKTDMGVRRSATQILKPLEAGNV